jgi:hypothetical protein
MEDTEWIDLQNRDESTKNTSDDQKKDVNLTTVSNVLNTKDQDQDIQSLFIVPSLIKLRKSDLEFTFQRQTKPLTESSCLVPQHYARYYPNTIPCIFEVSTARLIWLESLDASKNGSPCIGMCYTQSLKEENIINKQDNKNILFMEFSSQSTNKLIWDERNQNYFLNSENPFRWIFMDFVSCKRLAVK